MSGRRVRVELLQRGVLSRVRHLLLHMRPHGPALQDECVTHPALPCGGIRGEPAVCVVWIQPRQLWGCRGGVVCRQLLLQRGREPGRELRAQRRLISARFAARITTSSTCSPRRSSATSPSLWRRSVNGNFLKTEQTDIKPALNFMRLLKWELTAPIAEERFYEAVLHGMSEV